MGLNNERVWRWNVCHSIARFIEVGDIEVGVLGLNNGRDGGGVCVIQVLELKK